MQTPDLASAPPPVRDRDIVVIGLQPWYYDIGSNCKNIATWFARHNRVLYVNLPINRKTFLSSNKNPGIRQHCEVIKGKGETIRPIRENMWEFYPTSVVESINGLPSTKVFKAINWFNNRRFARNIRQAVRTLGFKDIILFNDNDVYNGFYLKELLQPSLYIYYFRDFLQGFDYWKKHVSVLEPQLIKKADAAVTNSVYYAEYCSTHNPHSYYIGQGCNLELFNTDIPHPKPEELTHLSSPIIGYVGAIDSSRLDDKILAGIATENPDWTIVMVGPEDDFFKASGLHQLPNIHFIGRRPLQQLPDFVAHFDVCINPQFNNEITKGNYPLKIDEYLALGKPVVATRTRTMKLFEEYTYLADTPGEYTALIRQALKEDSPAQQTRRIAFARSHTWDNSMAELYKVLNDLL
ncbi:MAG: glycosyltransferase [Chitinophagaceae bacterium]|nr:glycosyltransferase [Chitinophagaceae bacterium]